MAKSIVKYYFCWTYGHNNFILHIISQVAPI
jgi:hypothetical protein